MPLDLRLIVVGDRHGTADFHDIEPELSEQAVYGEYEDDLQLTEVDDMAQWLRLRQRRDCRSAVADVSGRRGRR